jgi:hypothetical protein
MGKELTALNEIGVQRRKVAPLRGRMQDISFTLDRFSNERLSVIHDKKQAVQVSNRKHYANHGAAQAYKEIVTAISYGTKRKTGELSGFSRLCHIFPHERIGWT